MDIFYLATADSHIVHKRFIVINVPIADLDAGDADANKTVVTDGDGRFEVGDLPVEGLTAGDASQAGRVLTVTDADGTVAARARDFAYSALDTYIAGDSVYMTAAQYSDLEDGTIVAVAGVGYYGAEALMAHWTSDALPVPTQSDSGFLTWASLSLGSPVNTSLVVGGAAAYVRQLLINLNANPQTALTLETASTNSMGGGFSGPELTDQWEQNWVLGLSYNDQTWTLAHDQYSSLDSTEPYRFGGQDQAAIETAVAMQAAIGNNAGAVLTLWDGAGTDPFIPPDAMPSLPAVADVTYEAGTQRTLQLPVATDLGDEPSVYTVRRQSQSGLPAGFGFNANTRVLTIAATVVAGNHDLRYTITDTDGDTASEDFRVTMTAADTTPVLPVIDDIDAPLGEVHDTILPAATGGNPPLSYDVAGRPGQIRFRRSDRRLRVRDVTPAGEYDLTYSATDDDNDTATRDFTVTVAAPAPEPAAGTLKVRRDGVTYTRMRRDGVTYLNFHRG